MGRHAAVGPSLHLWANGYWYHRIPGVPGYHSTGTRDRAEAGEILKERLKSAADLTAPAARRTLGSYAAGFFIWDSCPHVRRLLDEGKEITRRWAGQQRRWLERYLLGIPDQNVPADPLAGKRLGEITRADLIAFRSRLLVKLGDKRNTANKVVGMLKVIFAEAGYREELNRDPSAGIGLVKEQRREPGIFTRDELAALFPAEGLGPWPDLQTFCAFQLAADLGMRRGEILALRWRAIDFGAGIVTIDEAWKGGHEIGTPKWGRKRQAALPATTAARLQELLEDSVRVASTDFVFCDLAGERRGETWWQKRFTAAMKRAGIDVRARRITPHSFRHTLNSILLTQGADPLKVRAALGWASSRIQERYLHVGVEDLRGVADMVDERRKEAENDGE